MDQNERNCVLHAMIYRICMNIQRRHSHPNRECMQRPCRTDALEYRRSEKYE